MTGPQHLWSGNWEEDSSQAQDELGERRVVPRDPEPRTTPAPTQTRSTLRRRTWIVGGSLVLIVAAVAIALSALGGSSGSRTAVIAPTAPAPSLAATPPATPTTQPGPSSPPVEWLGMELVSVAPGGATVDTVRLGSAGDRAGLSPGDVILEVDNRNVSDAGAIAKVISGLHAGDKVQLQVSHGSELFQTTVTLGASPSRYP